MTDNFSNLLQRANAAFGPRIRPSCGDLIDADAASIEEARRFVIPKTWLELATSPLFTKTPLDPIDLGDIPAALSQVGMQYYLPGLLLHFLRFGTYAGSIWGPAFYPNFIRRLQPDHAQVVAGGGCSAYFGYTQQQEAICAELLWDLYLLYGDEFEDVPMDAYEYRDLAQHSISRALQNYWLSRVSSPDRLA